MRVSTESKERGIKESSEREVEEGEAGKSMKKSKVIGYVRRFV